MTNPRKPPGQGLKAGLAGRAHTSNRAAIQGCWVTDTQVTEQRTGMLSSEAGCALRVPAAALAVCVPVVAGRAGTATWGRVVARIHRYQGLACRRQEMISVQRGAGDTDALSPS